MGPSYRDYAVARSFRHRLPPCGRRFSGGRRPASLSTRRWRTANPPAGGSANMERPPEWGSGGRFSRAGHGCYVEQTSRPRQNTPTGYKSTRGHVLPSLRAVTRQSPASVLLAPLQELRTLTYHCAPLGPGPTGRRAVTPRFRGIRRVVTATLSPNEPAARARRPTLVPITRQNS